MSFSTSANGPNSIDFYWAKASDIEPPQTLSLAGNTLALSGGGGAVSVAAATAVALSTNKLTNTTYDALLDKTSTSGQTIVLEPALAVRIQPKLEVESELSVQSIGGKVTIINGIDGIYTTGNLQTLAEIKDSFGNPGAAGQQLQSSGPGLPWVWGAGAGVGVTAVVAGSNISVDNTNPIAPVVNVAISSTLDMSGQNIINGNDITLKGTNPSVDFKNTAGVQKASLDYVELTDKVTLTGQNVIAESLGAGGPRLLLDATAGNATLRANNIDVRLQRWDATGTVVDSSLVMTSTGAQPSQIVDNVGSVGNPGDYLIKSGGGDLTWAAATPGLWAGTALTDLDMNGFKIVDNTGSVNVQPLSGNVQLYGDIASGNPPALSFYDTSTPSTVSLKQEVPSVLKTDAYVFSAASGAVEGAEMGYDSANTLNYVAGHGLEFRVAQDPAKIATDYMTFDTGSGTGGIAIETTEYFDVRATLDARIQSAGNVSIINGTTPNATFFAGGVDMNLGSVEGVSFLSLRSDITTLGQTRIFMNEQSTLNNAIIENNGTTFDFIRGGAATLTEARFMDYPVVNISAPTPKLQLTAGTGTPADMRYDGTNLLLTANNAQTGLVVNGSETQIVGNNGLSAPARLVITDPNTGNQSSIQLYGSQYALQQTGEFYEVFGGANAITRIVADSLNGESAVSAEAGDLNLRALSGTVKMGDTKAVGNSTTVKVEDSIQTITLTASPNVLSQTTTETVIEKTDGSDVKLKLLNSGGKYGQLIASETGGYMMIQAESGYNMVVESTTGGVNISAANPDSTVTASVNGGTAQLTLTDVAGIGDLTLDANGNILMPSIPSVPTSHILFYDTVTKAVSYGVNALAPFVIGAASATPIVLTPADNNKTYIFTALDGGNVIFNTAALGTGNAGFTISIRNGIGVGANDLIISYTNTGIPPYALLGTLHNRTGSVNASTVPLYWTGTEMRGYF